MFMRATLNAGGRKRNIRHDRKELGGQIIVPKKFSQPAAIIVIFFQIVDDHVVDNTFVKFHSLLEPDFATRLVA